MTIFEQMLNIQEYGDKGGKMNYKRVRDEMNTRSQDQKKKKKDQEDTMTFIEKFVIDMFKATGKAVLQQAIDELLDGFNNGK